MNLSVQSSHNISRAPQNRCPLFVSSRYATKRISIDNNPMVEYKQIFCMTALRSISFNAKRASSVIPRISPSYAHDQNRTIDRSGVRAGEREGEENVFEPPHTEHKGTAAF